MAYINHEHDGRKVIVPIIENVFSELSTKKTRGATKVYLTEYEPQITLYMTPEIGSSVIDRNIYNFPFLFELDGFPWFEANSYLLSLVVNSHCSNRPTDSIRIKASRLLDYKLFCEREGLDWLDFTGKRPSNRPTYKYFNYLHLSSKKKPAVINQFTAVVYDFYKFVSKYWHHIDMDRVDTVNTVKYFVQTSTGSLAIDRVKRSQTLRTPSSSPPEIGYVTDHGEDLRPLKNEQLSELLDVISTEKWTQLERLILKTALYTGARKQTVLTIRVKHIKQFTDLLLRQDGTYRLDAGPGTGIDTKFGKDQDLYFPKILADELTVFSKSVLFNRRRIELKQKMAAEFPSLPVISHDDTYLFLSNQGNCYYMASDDPRYPYVRSIPSGQVTATITEKLKKNVSDDFPKGFSYHWLRATYAYQRYQNLEQLVENGSLSRSDQISWIQRRLHHRSRETTENYLKLFKVIDDRVIAQNLFEEKLFSFSGLKTKPMDEKVGVRNAY